MVGISGRMAVIATFACMVSASGTALAQNEVVSEARVAAAKRHMQSVCQPLEADKQFGKAARCYANVTAYLTDPTVTLAGATQPRFVRERLEAPTRVAMIAPRRGSGLLTSNFVLLGVGY